MSVNQFRASTRSLTRFLDQSLARLGNTPPDQPDLERMRWFWLDSFFANMSMSFYTTYVPLFALAYGASNAQVGQLTAIASLLAVLALFPGARAIPAFGRRKPIVLLFGGGLARVLLVGLVLLPLVVHNPAHIIWAVIALNGLINFANNFSSPAWTSLAADIVPTQMRGRFFAHRGQAINLVTLTMVPFAGWLIKTANSATGQAFPGYQLAFAVAFAIGAVATWSYAHIDEPASPPEATGGSPLPTILAALRGSPIFLGYVAATLVWNLGFQISLPFFNVYLIGPLGANTTVIGVVSAVMPFTALLTQHWLGRLIDRRGNVWVLTVSALGIPLFPLFWVFVTQWWHVILINIPAGVFWTGFNLAAFNLLLELAPPEFRADSAALYQFMVAGAAVVGPLLGGYLADAAGFKVTFAVSAFGRLLGALAFLWWVARPTARQSRASAA